MLLVVSTDRRPVSIVSSFASRFFGQALDGRGFRFGDFALINLRIDRLCDNFQLLARSRAIDVHGNEQRTMAAIFEPVR